MVIGAPAPAPAVSNFPVIENATTDTFSAVWHGPIISSLVWDPDYLRIAVLDPNNAAIVSETNDDTQAWTRSVLALSPGKWYWEIRVQQVSDTAVNDNVDQFVGIRSSDTSVATALDLGFECLMRTKGAFEGSALDLYVGISGANKSGSFNPGVTGLGRDDVVGIAFNMLTGKMWFRSLNYGIGTTKWLSINTDPATDNNWHISDISALKTWHLFWGADNDDGQNKGTLISHLEDFYMVPPDGFLPIPAGAYIKVPAA